MWAPRLARLALLASTALLCGAPARGAPQEGDRVTTVGVPAWIREVVLPGSELKAAPVTLETPVVLRIDEVRPHGDAFRYDLVYYGLDPGHYDLRDFLERRDGSSTAGLPALEVEVRSVLPPGQVMPNTVRGGEVPDVGGYRFTAWTAGALWLVVLVAILTVGRKRRHDDDAVEARSVTLADRLQPLVEEALAGRLAAEDRAELELGLIAFWRARLGLGEVGAAEAIALLKEHDEAGPLLRSLEDWLHRPEPPEDVDVARLLEPYRELPADALESVSSTPAGT